jgi:hypothetical protein
MADLTPATIFEEINNRLKGNPDKAKAINAIYQFNITGDQGGTWTVDCMIPEAKSGAAANAGCTITIGDKDRRSHPGVERRMVTRKLVAGLALR